MFLFFNKTVKKIKRWLIRIPLSSSLDCEFNARNTYFESFFFIYKANLPVIVYTSTVAGGSLTSELVSGSNPWSDSHWVL